MYTVQLALAALKSARYFKRTGGGALGSQAGSTHKDPEPK